MASDFELLQRYSRAGSEEAFAILTQRHMNLVYGAALRTVRSPALAEEVCQTVFADLARQAARLTPQTKLPGWLYQVARRTAIDLVRHESRRQRRERQADAHTSNQSNSCLDLQPALDTALEQLSVPDREAILLRYVQGQTLREMGDQLHISEDAAQKRVSRALARLRQHLTEQDFQISVSLLTAQLAAQTIPPATASLGGFGTFVSSTTKAATMTTGQKLLLGVASLAVVSTGLLEEHRIARLKGELHRSRPVPLEAASQPPGPVSTGSGVAAEEQVELLRLRGEVTVLRGRNQELTEQIADMNRERAARVAVRAAPYLEALGSRIEQMQVLLSGQPDQQIPELQLLQDRDWVEAAGEVDSNADWPKALAHLRTLAKNRLAHLAMKALQNYAETHDGHLPAELTQLHPYLPDRLPRNILDRYKLVAAGTATELKPGHSVIQEIGPVDPRYDTVHSVGLNGSGFSFPDEAVGGMSRQLGYTFTE